MESRHVFWTPPRSLTVTCALACAHKGQLATLGQRLIPHSLIHGAQAFTGFVTNRSRAVPDGAKAIAQCLDTMLERKRRQLGQTLQSCLGGLSGAASERVDRCCDSGCRSVQPHGRAETTVAPRRKDPARTSAEQRVQRCCG